MVILTLIMLWTPEVLPWKQTEAEGFFRQSDGYYKDKNDGNKQVKQKERKKGI